MNLHQLSADILDKLTNNEGIVVATIVSQQGSTPRGAGTKMVIFKSGEFVGTIGGGIFESLVVERSVQILAEHMPAFMAFDLTSQDLAATEMICGGRLEVFLDPLRPDEETVEVFRAWKELIAAGRAGVLITAVTRKDEEPLQVKRCLVDDSGATIGKPAFSLQDIGAALKKAQKEAVLQVEIQGRTTYLLEPTIKTKTAYLVGAGHVSRPTAHLAALTGFRVVVLDDRPEFANRNRFPEAADIVILQGYGNFAENLVVDEDSFIVIVTRGHLHDKEALAQALKTRAGYVGMIGSSRKRKTIYQALLNEGFTNEDIDRVHSPIGLSIGAETPEEIAVSIVAEMIQFRAAQDKD